MVSCKLFGSTNIFKFWLKTILKNRKWVENLFVLLVLGHPVFSLLKKLEK